MAERITPGCGSRRFIRGRARAAALSLALVASAVMWVATPSSSAYIYVAGPVHVEIPPDDSGNTFPVPDPSTIERLTLDGSFVQPNFIDGPLVYSGDQLHVDGDRLYWLDSSGNKCRVVSASLAGTDVRTLATLSSEWPCGSGTSMALAGEYLYWGGPAEGTIGRVSTRPPYIVEPDFIRPPLPGDLGCCALPVSLVSDGSWLYWFDEERDTVGRVRLDGTDLEPALFQPEPATPTRVALNVGLLGVAQGYLWWDNGYGTGSVGRARPDGSDPERGYLTGIQQYDGALTPQGLYYTGSACDETVEPSGGCVDVDGTVSRIALESGATPEVVAHLGQSVGYSIAVDSLDAPFSLQRISKHRDGTATAVVSAPTSADVSVHGRRIVPATASYPRPKVAQVDIRPRRRTRRALRRHSVAHVRVRIKVQSGGSPWWHNQRLTLRLGRRR
jgi:hypothetical protein